MQIEERPTHKPDVNKCILAITTFPTMHSMSNMCNMNGKHVKQTCTTLRTSLVLHMAVSSFSEKGLALRNWLPLCTSKYTRVIGLHFH